MCIWKVAEEDRHCEYCSYRGGCERYEVKPLYESRAQYFIRVMNDIIGDNVLRRSRKRELVWGRNIVAYQMKREKFQSVDIAKCLGLRHCTITHAVSSVVEMLNMPGLYQNEMRLWNFFQEMISLQK